MVLGANILAVCINDYCEKNHRTILLFLAKHIFSKEFFSATGNSRGDPFKIPLLPPAKRPPNRLKKIEPIRTVSTVEHNSTISVSSHVSDDDTLSIAA